jgi:hypothetical protein
MSKIKNMGTATMKFNEGIIVSGSSPQLYVSGNVKINSTLEPEIQFQVGEEDRAKISINSSNNLVFHQQYVNKHIVFKVNDQGVTREGLRLNGTVPEVVINEQHGVNGDDSLVDFRVESESQTHMLFVEGANDKVGIGTSQPDYTLHVAGEIGVDQYIRHNGDPNTHINFTDDQIVLKAGNVSMVKMEQKASAPHEVTINDGSNNIDFIVKGNGSNQGNPGMKFDASTNRLGINGVGTPSWELDVAGDIGLAEYIYHRTDTDTYIRFQDDEISLSAGGREFVASSGAGVDNNFFASGSIRSRGTATRGTAVFGGDLVVSGTLTTIQKHICTAKYTVDNSTQQYIRFNAAGSNDGPLVNNKFIAPCAGNLSYVMIRSTGTPGQTAVAFHRALDGTENLSTTPIDTVNITMGTANTVYQAYFSPAANFGPGDIVGLSVDPAANHGNVDITLVFELDFVL